MAETGQHMTIRVVHTEMLRATFMRHALERRAKWSGNLVTQAHKRGETSIIAMSMRRSMHPSGPREAVTKRSAFHARLSPPLWKDQLRQRCMERLKANRQELMAKLRSPDANIADEMKRLVYREEQREGRNRRMAKNRSSRHPVFDLQCDSNDDEEDDDGDLVTIEDLMLRGKLSEQDYLDILHSLEDELQYEWDADDEDERLAEEMVEFEEASLAAMLAGIDLGGNPHDDEEALMAAAAEAEAMYGEFGSAGEGAGIHVLCPMCKTGSLTESSQDTSSATVSCQCGFSFRVKNILHGALEDLQEKISDAFMTHRDKCHADPTFAVVSDLDGENEVTDSLLMGCDVCGHECLVR